MCCSSPPPQTPAASFASARQCQSLSVGVCFGAVSPMRLGTIPGSPTAAYLPACVRMGLHVRAACTESGCSANRLQSICRHPHDLLPTPIGAHCAVPIKCFRLADFGLSRMVAEHKTHVSAATMGTVPYMPPEHLSSQRLSKAVDIYSIGIISAPLRPDASCNCWCLQRQDLPSVTGSCHHRHRAHYSSCSTAP